jgi:hypothetical protein
MRKSARQLAIRNLVAAYSSVEWTESALRSAHRIATGSPLKRTSRFLRRMLTRFPACPPLEELLTYLKGNLDWGDLPIRRVFILPERMEAPPAADGDILLPQLPTEVALASWLGIAPGRLRWLADITGRNRKHPTGPLRTYRYRWVAKRAGRFRLLEIPRTSLKLIQRKILVEILDQIPPHAAAHGFRTGRSIVTNAAPHCGKKIVLRMDLKDFFPSVRSSRVYRIFRTFGYPELGARLLSGLCTTRLPSDVWDARSGAAYDGSDHSQWLRLSDRHLPQGAPTSPALANLAAFRLDRRLVKLAACVGADYTRYADDLAFSGGDSLAKRVKRFALRVAVIAMEEGFVINHRKTRIMRQSVRQQIAGVIVNVKPNTSRREFDQLRAILTNCVRHGSSSQNRDLRADYRAHLSGRVSQFRAVNPDRGRKLLALFEQIVWTNIERPTGTG